MNLALAIGSALLFALLLVDRAHDWELLVQIRRDPSSDTWHTMFLLPIAVMAVYSVLINVLLMLFNLLPIPHWMAGEFSRVFSHTPRRWRSCAWNATACSSWWR